MVSEQTPRLVSAVANPKRRIAESSIRKPNDIVIFVEGEFDRMFFKRYSSNPNLTFKNIGRKKGKSDICNIVSSTPEYYGIVDMDYDFDSIKTTHVNLIDTSQQCCLYSYIVKDSGSNELNNLVEKVIHHVCTRLQDPLLNMKRNEMIDRLKYGGDKLEKFVLERTKAVLYRGHLGDSGVMVPPREGECLLNDIESRNGNPVRDLINDSMSEGYENFKREHMAVLASSGANDHTIFDAIIIYIKFHYSGFKQYETLINNLINRKLNNLIIERGNSSMADHFLSELGLIVKS